MGIYRLEVDLSKELTAPSKPKFEEKVEATAQVWYMSWKFYELFIKGSIVFIIIFLRVMATSRPDGNQHQPGMSKRNGIEPPRLQLEAVYVIFLIMF